MPRNIDHSVWKAAEAAVKAMEALREEEMGVQALQDRFPAARDREALEAEIVK